MRTGNVIAVGVEGYKGKESVVVVAEIIGLVLGTALAVIRIRRVPVLNQLSALYISFVRGTPILVQLMLVYYGLPPLVEGLTGVSIARWDAIYFAVAALALNEGAFVAEIFRSSIASVPAGQSEAGWASGLSRWATLRRIVLPQALRVGLPALGVSLIGLVQGTSLVFMLGVVDVMGQASALGASTGRTVGPYLVVAIIYVALSLAIRAVLGLSTQQMAAGRKVAA